MNVSIQDHELQQYRFNFLKLCTPNSLSVIKERDYKEIKRSDVPQENRMSTENESRS